MTPKKALDAGSRSTGIPYWTPDMFPRPRRVLLIKVTGQDGDSQGDSGSRSGAAPNLHPHRCRRTAGRELLSDPISTKAALLTGSKTSRDKSVLRFVPTPHDLLEEGKATEVNGSTQT